MQPNARVDRLRHVRHERSAFDARFYEKHPDFWPIARAAATFAGHASWPAVTEYDAAFERPGPVTFQWSSPKRRRPSGEPIDRATLYDTMIVERGTVPTRERMWHDFLNAMVWATFPRAKLELHRRQYAAIAKWIPPGATQLPNARTRELDALALVDEGGVIILDHGPRASARKTRLLFGHALFEGLVFEQPAMIARAVVLQTPESDEDPIATADRLLAATLVDRARIVSPDELPRVELGDARGALLMT